MGLVGIFPGQNETLDLILSFVFKTFHVCGQFFE